VFKSFKNRNTWDLIWQFFKTDFKLKYNNSILGFLWVLIKPLVLFAVLYTVTSKVFVNQNITYYPFFLLLGTIVNSFWGEGTMSGLNSILGKSGLILKVNFPRYIVVVSATLIPIINLIINSAVFFVLLLIFKDGPTPDLIHYAWFVICMLGLYMLIFAFSLFTSILYTKYRDIQHIWELVLQMMFWITPIVYNPYAIFKPGILKDIVTKYNPVGVFITSARDAVVYKDIQRQGLTFAWIGIAFVLLNLGYFYFKNSVKRVAENF
jgi:ABC-type polysaccharide/polyol phosphate export permease